MIKTLDITDAQRRLDELVRDVCLSEQRIIIKKNGRPWAALISDKDLERLNGFEEQHRATVAVLDQLNESFPDLPPKVLERQVLLAIAASWAEKDSPVEQASLAWMMEGNEAA